MRANILKISISCLILIAGPVAQPIAYAAEPVAPQNSICNLPDVILGTTGNDIINGTSGDDVICGLGGTDTIDGKGGDDILIGGNDVDTIIGGEGNDQIVGAIGQDDLAGGVGNDQIWGGDGNDMIDGGSEPDYISGGPGADNLFGSSGADRLLGEAGDDSLNGGPDIDIMNGGPGKNICQKQTGETLTSCYFDKYGPQLVNVAVDPSDATLDSTDPNRRLRIRFTVADAGTGILQAGFGFADSAQYGLFFNEANFGRIRHKDVISVGVAISNGAIERCPEPRIDGPYTCLVAGSLTYGTFESSINLPRNMLTSTYRLVEFGATDQVQNQTYWSASKVKSKNMAVSFKQTGVNDRLGPEIRDFTIVGTREALTENTVSFAKISFTDASGNGLSTFQSEYSLLKDSRHHFYLGGEFSESDYTTPCPEDLTTFLENCKISGDKFGGVLYMRIGFGGYNIAGDGRLKKGLGKPWQITAKDFVENERTYKKLNKSIVDKNLVYEGYGFDADNDFAAPTLVSLSASKETISTISSSQSVTYKWVAKDVGKGLDTSTSFLSPIRTYSDNGNGGGAGECTTQTPKSLGGGKYAFITTCVFPAHYTSGTFKLYLQLNDKSANGNYTIIQSSDLQDRGMPYQLVNH